MNSETSNERMLCEKMLAERWSCSVKMLQKARLEGTLVPYVKLSRGLIRYRLSDVIAYEAERLRTSTSDRGTGK